MTINKPLPFEIPNVNHGIVVIKGLLHLKKSAIALEFDKRDGFVGILKSDLEEVVVPFSDIDSITLIKKLFITRVEIVGSSMKSLHNIPGSEQGRVLLKIKRKHRKLAESLLSSARLNLSEFKLTQLEENH